MSTARYDVLVVGARCAGASLATHLARAGVSVALLDAASLPSDQPMSTHLIQPPGMDELDRLGVGEQVRRLSPAITAVRSGFDDEEMVLRYGDGRAAHCLRREKLDRLLQDAAVAAGARLQDESRVISLVRDSRGRVCGAEVRRRDGRVERISAGLVVGADGRNSTVARLVGAEEYLAYDGPRACCWAYWRRPDGWDPATLYNGVQREHSRVLFPTDEDMVLVASSPPIAHAARWRGDRDAIYLSDIRSCPPLAAAFGNNRPVTRIRALTRARYFFRVAAGPGWALAGDAGHHKEFFTGLGISDALRDGAALASAAVEGTDLATVRYWRRRDAVRVGMHRWGEELGAADNVSALERMVARRARSEPAMLSRLGAVIDGVLPASALFPVSRVLPWALRELLRGDAGPLSGIPGRAVRAWRTAMEKRYRERLLENVKDPTPAEWSLPVMVASPE